MERLKDGQLSAKSRAVPEHHIRLLDEYVTALLEKLGSAVMEGNIARLPYERKNRTACDWCALRDACPQDRRLEGCRWRKLAEYADHLLWRWMTEERKETPAGQAPTEGGYRGEEDGKSMDRGTAQSH